VPDNPDKYSTEAPWGTYSWVFFFFGSGPRGTKGDKYLVPGGQGLLRARTRSSPKLEGREVTLPTGSPAFMGVI